MENSCADSHHVVIIGAGFAGLAAAKGIGNRKGYRVTLIDRRNYSLFQPLLYQVATGFLAPGDIASPARDSLRRYRHLDVLMATVHELDPDHGTIHHDRGSLRYDTLIVACGMQFDYFGNEQWKQHAPGLKSFEDAATIRHNVFSALEAADIETDPARRRRLMTFAISGAGPTGVELAGTLAVLTRQTLRGDYRHIDTRDCRIFLVDAASRVLPPMPETLSTAARRQLEDLGVTVTTDTMVKDIEQGKVCMSGPDSKASTIEAETIIWAAGMKAVDVAGKLAERTGVKPAKGGKLPVEDDLSLPGYPQIFIAGDLAYLEQDGQPLPGLAQVALQQGRYLGKRLARTGRSPPFHYKDKGMMAVIGRNRAVGALPWMNVSGFPAWALWLGVHIFALFQWEKRLRVALQWSIKYLSHKTGDRLVTDPPGRSAPPARQDSPGSAGAGSGHPE